MKISWNWLLELCDLDQMPTASEGAAALTRLGLEVEGMVALGAAFSGVLVAEVVGRRPHPGSDKLSLVDVITACSGVATQVVCGASNVPAAGRKVLWAPPGAQLPAGITLATKTVKGVESPGMLCSEIELGVGDDDSGIIVLADGDAAPLGSAAQAALGVDDVALEINAPANRPDVLGHLGVARELCAALGGRVVFPRISVEDLTDPELDVRRLVQVAIEDSSLCSRYTARVIDGVTVAPSPRKFAQRLRTVGVRPISNLVDVTNYVMFELGQPMHAFDWHRVAHAAIRVRAARPGETMVTLDKVERALTSQDAVISDGQHAIAIAGVMGGQSSEVSAKTTRVLLESATFSPLSVRRTARRLGLHSESSHRFERGVDPELAARASARAALLLATLAGGRIASGVVDAYAVRSTPTPLRLRLPRLASLSGVQVAAEDAAAALRSLECEVAAAGEDSLLVTPPSDRADIVREVDLIEEVLRVRGYELVPTTLPPLRETPQVLTTSRGDDARRLLAAAGLCEAITYGFSSLERLAKLQLAASDVRNQPVVLKNPMSAEQAIMRTSLLPNLLAAVARNRSFGRNDVALFEVGSVFWRRSLSSTDHELNELADEPLWATAVLCGQTGRHLAGARAWDFFDAKGLIQALISGLTGQGRLADIDPAHDIPYFHPGLAAAVRIGEDDPLGTIGEVHPDVRAAHGIDVPVFAFELALDRLPRRGPAQMATIPRFPGSMRDVSLLMDDSTPARRVEQIVAAAREPLMSELAVLEDYRDRKLPPGKKSMLWSMFYRAADRTLTDAEVDRAHEALVAQLVAQLPAQRR
jgi:phenylalanyl-tRNA synthetase beta chain